MGRKPEPPDTLPDDGRTIGCARVSSRLLFRRARLRASCRRSTSRGSRSTSRRSSCFGGGACRSSSLCVLFGVVLRLAAGNRRDREVAICDGRVRVRREGDRRNPDRVTDLECGNIEDEFFGDGVSRANKFDLVAHDVERAAALDAGETPSPVKCAGTFTRIC